MIHEEFFQFNDASPSCTANSLGHSAAAVEIEYWQYTYASRVEAIDKLIEKFEAVNPGITVKHTHFPYADYRKKVAIAVSAGDGPDVGNSTTVGFTIIVTQT